MCTYSEHFAGETNPCHCFILIVSHDTEIVSLLAPYG